MGKKISLPVILCLLRLVVNAQLSNGAVLVREVDSLIQESRALAGQGFFERSLDANAAAEKLAIEKLGSETLPYGNACFNRGKIYYFKGEYREAEQWYLEAKAIRERWLGREHLDYAQTLNNLANLYWKTGTYEKAESLHLEAKAIREKLLGKENLVYAATLNNLANVYYDLGR